MTAVPEDPPAVTAADPTSHQAARVASADADGEPMLPGAPAHEAYSVEVGHLHLDGVHLPDHPIEPPHALGPVDHFDNWVDRQLDRLRGTEPADRILYGATELGDFGLIWLLIGAVRSLGSDDLLREGVRLTACLATESVVVNGAVKQLFQRERPVPDFERPYKIRMPLTTSFPSGHSSSAFLAASLLSERSRVKPLWFALAGTVAMSRAYVKIHHPSDVVGGAVLGLTLGAVVKRAWPLPDRGSGAWRGRARRRRR